MSFYNSAYISSSQTSHIRDMTVQSVCTLQPELSSKTHQAHINSFTHTRSLKPSVLNVHHPRGKSSTQYHIIISAQNTSTFTLRFKDVTDHLILASLCSTSSKVGVDGLKFNKHLKWALYRVTNIYLSKASLSFTSANCNITRVYICII